MAKDTASKGVIELKLANGKEYVGTCGYEMLCFYESDGASIVPGKKKSKHRRKNRKSKPAKKSESDTTAKGEKKKRQARHLT